MKTIILANSLKKMRKYKIAVIILCVILAGGCAFAGRSYAQNKAGDSEEIEEYNKMIADYEKVSTQIQTTIDTAQKAVDQQQDFCDNSIYMKLDPNKVYVSNVKYIASSLSDSESPELVMNHTTNIMAALSGFVSSGDLKGKIADAYGSDAADDMTDLVSAKYENDILTVTILGIDQKSADELRQVVETSIEDYVATSQTTLGAYSLVKIDEASFSKADYVVLNSQNSHLSNLDSYLSSLSDYKKRLMSEKLYKREYNKTYKPDGVDGVNTKLIMGEFAVLGIVLGLVLPFLLFILKDILSNTVKGEEELMNAGLRVYGTYNEKQGDCPKVKRVCMELANKVADTNKKICFVPVQAGDSAKEIAEKYMSELKEMGCEATYLDALMEDCDQLSVFETQAACIFIVAATKTSYTELEKYRTLCADWKVEKQGSIIIE